MHALMGTNPTVSKVAVAHSNTPLDISILTGTKVRNLSLLSVPTGTELISSISSTERGEVFYGPTDWLGSCDPLTPVQYMK
jgi:hypothetical protein